MADPTSMPARAQQLGEQISSSLQNTLVQSLDNVLANRFSNSFFDSLANATNHHTPVTVDSNSPSTSNPPNSPIQDSISALRPQSYSSRNTYGLYKAIPMDRLHET